MIEIKCPLCDIYSNDVVINENGYTGKKCDNCKMIFISPRPKLDQVINIYKKNCAHIPAESHIARSYAKRLYARHNISLIKRYISMGSILEIGAGGGYFLDEAKKEGFEVCGIELNPKQAQFINNNLKLDCETTPLSIVSFKGKNFDLIYHCDVISHFYDPIETFITINLKLKEDGFVVFETGNLGDVDYQYFKYISSFQFPDHLFFFSEYSIEKMLEKTGFELIKIYRYSIMPQLILSKIIRSIFNIVNHPLEGSISIENRNNLYDINDKIKSNLNQRSKSKQLLNNIYGYISYFIRYNIGSIYLKKKRPQTIIIVAQKRKVYKK